MACTSTFAATGVYVDQTTLKEHESLTLTISTDQVNASTPDLSSLQKDFTISNPSTNQQMTISNGVYQLTREWTFTLQPKRTGALIIPEFNIGQDKTDPIRVQVKGLDLGVRALISEVAFFETSIDTSEQYVQAPIHISRSFYIELSQIRNIEPNPPNLDIEIEGVLVQPKGEPTLASERRNGREYRVIRQDYLILSERSGKLEIPSISVLVTGMGFVPGETGPIRFLVSSEPKTIKVLPIPDSYPSGAPWFPATSVKITEILEGVDDNVVNVGDSFTRTITITATDSQGSSIPPVSLDEITFAKTYSEPAHEDSELTQTSVAGARIETFTLVLTEPGAWTLPEAKLTWWNTNTHKLETTSVGGKTIEVGGSIQPAPVLSQDTTPDIGTIPTSKPEFDNEISPSTPVSQSWPSRSTVALTAGGWILALIVSLVYFLQRRHWRLARTKRTTKAESFKWNTSNPAEVRKAMSSWISNRLNISINAATRMIDTDVEGHQLLRRINQSIFGAGQEIPPPTKKEIMDVLERIALERQEKVEILPPLHAV